MAGEVVGTAYVEVRPKVDGFANEAQSKIAAPLQAAFAGIATGVAAAKIKDFFKSSFSEAEEAAKVTAQTGAVLKSTGEAAGVTAKHVEEYANQLSKLAAVDDEVIQQGENVLLTFTQVRNEVGKGNDVFDRATLAALNLSATMHTDLQGAIVLVGKALNDPIRGLLALTRVGVTFTQQQRDQIAALQQSGDLLGAQKIILGELEREFGGAAASQATATKQLSVAFKNLEESIGTALLPLINALASGLTPLANILSENKLAATALAVVLSGALVAALAAWTIRTAQATVNTLMFRRSLSAVAVEAAEAETGAVGLASGLGLAAGIMGTAAIAGIGLAHALGQDAHALEVNQHALEGLTAAQLRNFVSQIQATGGFIKLEDVIRKIGATAPTTAKALVDAADLPAKARARLIAIIDQEVAAEKRAQSAQAASAGAYDDTSGSISEQIDWINLLNGKLNDQVDASLGSQGAAVSMDRAIQNLNETLATNAANTLEGRDATIQAEQSVISFGKKIYDERLAVSDSTQATYDQIGALAGVRDSLAPGSALRNFLDDYINKLRNDIPGEVHTDFLLTLSNQTGLSVGDLRGFEVLGAVLPQFASGGIVPGPVGAPTLAVVHGGEQVVPVGGSSSSSSGPTFIFQGALPPNPIEFGHITARVNRVHMALAGR